MDVELVGCADELNALQLMSELRDFWNLGMGRGPRSLQAPGSHAAPSNGSAFSPPSALRIKQLLRRRSGIQGSIG
jgi:hypothetical protein